jgi:hypothetical protein
MIQNRIQLNLAVSYKVIISYCVEGINNFILLYYTT